MSEPQPLIIKPFTRIALQPQSAGGLIILHRGELVELVCSDNFTAPFNLEKNLLVRCVESQTFTINNRKTLFNSFKCRSYPKHIARRTNRKCNNNTATLAEIGFAIDKNRFVHVMDVCHNEHIQLTYYTHFKLGPSNYGHQRNFPRPDFEVGDFFNRSRQVPILYTRRLQRETLGKLLGDQMVNRLLNDTIFLFMARGHLMAKSDNILGNQQRATFYYINVAPQWQPFNAGNWATVEIVVREYVSQQKLHAEVYTGTFGVLALRDCTGNFVDVYLDINNGTSNNCTGNGPHPKPDSSTSRLPVPLYYYKIVLTKDGRGVVFIGLNNPHATRDEIRSGKYDICPNVSQKIGWMNNRWNSTDIFLGYSYACDVNSFAKVVAHLPRSVKAKALL